jgi:hypothetical protein
METVIDASAKFAKKRTDDFSAKIGSVASSIADTFASQEANEKLVNSMIGSARKSLNDIISQRRFRLAVPSAFGPDEWGPNALVFDVISTTHPNSSDYDEIMTFIKDNETIFVRSLEHLRKTMKQIEATADSMKWGASWKRYTTWSTFVSDAQRFINVVEGAL